MRGASELSQLPEISKAMYKIAYHQPGWSAKAILNARFAESAHVIKGHVLDLGAGTQPFREEVLARNCTYTAVDWPASFHKLDRNIVLADLNQLLPLEARSFDTVLLLQVMEHLHSPALCLGECARVLKPDGAIMIMVPFMWRVHEEPYDFYRYTQFCLKRLLHEAGFTEVTVSATNGVMVTIALKLNHAIAYYVPKSLRALLAPWWALSEAIALLADRIVRINSETAYFVAIGRRAK